MTPLLIWREIVAKAFAVLTIITLTIAAIVGTILYGQYLAWHGPQWLMMVDRDGHQAFGLGSAFAFILMVLGEFIIGCILISYLNEDKSE